LKGREGQDNALSPTRQAKEGKGRIYQANPARPRKGREGYTKPTPRHLRDQSRPGRPS